MALHLVKPSLAELRQLMGASAMQARPRHHCSVYPDGFSVGSLVELTGTSKTEFVSLFLKENPQLKTAWVEDSITINPYALKQRGVNLDSLFFIEGGKETLWCLNQVLSSGCFQVIVCENARFTEKDLRRFQLLSEKTQNHFFLLSHESSSSWVPHVQLKISKPNNDWDIHTVRKRGAL